MGKRSHGWEWELSESCRRHSQLESFFPNISANKQRLLCAVVQISCRNSRGVDIFSWCSRALHFEFQQWKCGWKWLDQFSVMREGCISFVLLCLFSLYIIHIPEGHNLFFLIYRICKDVIVIWRISMNLNENCKDLRSLDTEKAQCLFSFLVFKKWTLKCY